MAAGALLAAGSYADLTLAPWWLPDGDGEHAPFAAKQIGRDHVAQALIHSAKMCERLGHMAQMAQNLRTFAQVIGFLEAPEEVAVVDPEERKRKICEAAASYGMVMPEVKATK